MCVRALHGGRVGPAAVAMGRRIHPVPVAEQGRTRRHAARNSEEVRRRGRRPSCRCRRSRRAANACGEWLQAAEFCYRRGGGRSVAAGAVAVLSRVGICVWVHHEASGGGGRGGRARPLLRHQHGHQEPAAVWPLLRPAGDAAELVDDREGGAREVLPAGADRAPGGGTTGGARSAGATSHLPRATPPLPRLSPRRSHISRRR